jgi:hypothetical protein
VRIRERSWSCTCGATIAVPADCPDNVWRDLVDTFSEGHEGDGHAECDRATARRARAKHERRELARARRERTA